MKVLMLLWAAVSLGAATPSLLYSQFAHPYAYSVYRPTPVAYSAAPIYYSAAAVAPASVSTQHHAQDTLGQYNYGYSNSNSAKQEVRTADGITRGGYSYVDANGIVQSTSYVSDPINGFRVAATNLPVGPAPAVVTHTAPAVVSVSGAAPIVSYPGLYSTLPVSSQYHAQDELGQYSYGYSGGPSAKQETRSVDGVTRGSYSYIDANGLVQTVRYEADAVHGFRVAATNLPIGPGAAETSEVKAAQDAHYIAKARIQHL